MIETKDQPQVRLTVRNGGWILIVAALFTIALLVWALLPVVMRRVSHAPGDGRTVESYAFDLTNITVPKDSIVPALRHRDFLPRWNDPPVETGAAIEALNEAQRGKILVSSDLVVGVVIGDVQRAYPIRLLNVHEVINDTVDGVPIAVTYNWHCDSVRVFDRRIGDRTVTLVSSGLFRNSNALFYDETKPAGAETLWQQITGEGLTGPHAGQSMTIVPSTLVNWSTWLAAHPTSDVVMENSEFHKRYKKAHPDAYFLKHDLSFDVTPLADENVMSWKTRTIAVEVNGRRLIFPVQTILDADVDAWTYDVDGTMLTFTRDRNAHAVEVNADVPLDDVLYAFWFAQHAFWPDAEVVAVPIDSDA
ncbi:MAG: DUF3179 domain-containing (seleno)protein [Planctomycetota bacterium]